MNRTEITVMSNLSEILLDKSDNYLMSKRIIAETVA